MWLRPPVTRKRTLPPGCTRAVGGMIARSVTVISKTCRASSRARCRGSDGGGRVRWPIAARAAAAVARRRCARLARRVAAARGKAAARRSKLARAWSCNSGGGGALCWARRRRETVPAGTLGGPTLGLPPSAAASAAASTSPLAARLRRMTPKTAARVRRRPCRSSRPAMAKWAATPQPARLALRAAAAAAAAWWKQWRRQRRPSLRQLPWWRPPPRELGPRRRRHHPWAWSRHRPFGPRQTQVLRAVVWRRMGSSTRERWA